MSELRELILKNLQQEGHISGEILGKRLKISRTAVWKHIKELRKRGYQIEASRKFGYSFVKSTTLLLPEEIKLGLNTRIMGKQVVHFDEISSTQDVAAELAIEGGAEGTLVVAEMQTRGRGRRGRNWASISSGGIYFSLILRPKLMPSKVVQIPLIASVALTKAIGETAPIQPKIKWPNDLYINTKKVGGILTEMNSEIDAVNYVILGIGLNVNMSASLFDEDISKIATSLIDECGVYISRAKLVQNFLSEFEQIYTKYLAYGFGSVRDEWKAFNNTIGSQVKISDGAKDIEGEAVDINNEGFLLVRKKNGDITRIISGDVSLNNPVQKA